MVERNLLNVNEVACKVGCSVQTISSYYKWKKENPENEVAKTLPDYEMVGPHKARYWSEDDIEKIIEFRANMPQGRNGILGSVTQRYVDKPTNNYKSTHKVREGINGSGYIEVIESILKDKNVDEEVTREIGELLRVEFEIRKNVKLAM